MGEGAHAARPGLRDGLPAPAARFPMRYSILSFDLDGTLVDSAAEIAAAANATLLEFEVPQRPLAQITGLIGRGTRELMLKLLEQTLMERPLRAAQLPVDEVLARFAHHYAATAGSSAAPYPGCRETLTRLRSGGVHLACVTNKEERFAARVLQATKLDDCFELLVGGDSLAHKKPHPSVLAHVLSRLGGRPEDAAHVGDSRIDVETARGAGVAAWAVPWGYNGGEAIEAAAPQRIFHSLPEIAAFVLAANRAAPGPR
jgi:phosphoglycolate phosphatase